MRWAEHHLAGCISLLWLQLCLALHGQHLLSQTDFTDLYRSTNIASIASGGAEFELLVVCGLACFLLAGSAGDDQRRVVTPPQAREWGVDFMVIGRPITRAENPTAAVDDILQSLS